MEFSTEINILFLLFEEVNTSFIQIQNSFLHEVQ